MKAYGGSLQKKGRRYYLVIYTGGKQRWLALKTDSLHVARARAAKLAPPDLHDDTAWLEKLSQEGSAAMRELSVRRIGCKLTWASIDTACTLAGMAERSAESRRSHARWFCILHRAVGQIPPGGITREHAAAAMASISARYVSSPRMLRFFRSAWREIGLDCSIWPKQVQLPGLTDRSEHYRRLSLEEIRKVHRHLLASAPPLADMFLIGYSTGLRLSDVAELEMSEVAGEFLKVCPNKTRRYKPRPLTIPLTPEAHAAVTRLLAAAATEQRRFLFSDRDRRDPSSRIARAFRFCNVLREGEGRASFHSLRATFISMMDEAGIPPHVTDAITGHGGGGMHSRYTQPSERALQAAVLRAIPPICCISAAWRCSGGGSVTLEN